MKRDELEEKLESLRYLLISLNALSLGLEEFRVITAFLEGAFDYKFKVEEGQHALFKE